MAIPTSAVVKKFGFFRGFSCLSVPGIAAVQNLAELKAADEMKKAS